MGIWAALRREFAAARARQPDAWQRVQVYGDTTGSEHGVTERLGIDEHRPVRPPDRWKEVYLLGGAVRVDGKWRGKFLLECPGCAALVVDKYAQKRHMEVCAAHASADEIASE